MYAVGMLSPTTGDVGESAATFSGGISLDPTLPTQNGKAVVTAANPTAALNAALVNTVVATFGGQSASYSPEPGTVGTTISAHLPFVVTTTPTAGEYTLLLEDLAGMPGLPADWDYNDRSWTVTVRELTVIAVSPPTPAEESADGSRPVVFTLTRSNGTAGALDQPLFLPFTLGGTATPGVDYDLPSSQIAVFWPGESTTKIVLPVKPDTTTEGPETITVTVTPPEGVAPYPTTTTTDIYDPGTLPPPPVPGTPPSPPVPPVVPPVVVVPPTPGPHPHPSPPSPPTTNTPTGTIHGWAWDDQPNGDGIRQASEAKRSGVGVWLYSMTSGGYVAQTWTNDVGEYQFTGLSLGSYRVAFRRPTGTAFTLYHQGTDRQIDSDVSVTAGDNGWTDVMSLTVSNPIEWYTSAGLLVPPATTPPQVRVSGSLDGEERPDGLRPVVFQLTRTNPASPNTAPALTVGFSLSGTATPVADYAAPYSYTATFAPGQLTTTVVLGVVLDTLVEGYESLALTINPSSGYSVVSGSETKTAFISDPATGTISGVVWDDHLNGNNIRDVNDPRLPNVAVDLYHNGVFKLTTYTNVNGVYAFSQLPSGNYHVRVSGLLHMVAVVPNYGTNDEIDSDVGSDGRSDEFVLPTGGTTHRDAGFNETPVSTLAHAEGEIFLGVQGGIGRNLRVAKWETAFESVPGAAAGALPTPVLRPLDANGYDFIDHDVDRFNVFVKDTARWPNTDAFYVTIETDNVAGKTEYNDPPTQVQVKKMLHFPGYYMSDSQLLVSNEKDDTEIIPAVANPNMPAAPGDPPSTGGGIRTDEASPDATKKNTKKIRGNNFSWEVSDRTHRIALGGKVIAKYTIPGGQPKQDDVVVPVAKVVKLHINIMRETVNGAAATTEAAVLADVAIMREIYAQVGLDVQLSNPPVGNNPPAPKVSDPPAGANLDKPIGQQSLDEYTENDKPTEEEQALLGAAGLRSAANDDVEVYYVYRLSRGSGGETFRLAKFPTFPALADSVVLATKMKFPPPAPEGDRVYDTSAHEVGHVLTEKGHYPYGARLTGAGRTNLMVDGLFSIETNTIFDSRRLTKDQETAMLTARPTLLHAGG